MFLLAREYTISAYKDNPRQCLQLPMKIGGCSPGARDGVRCFKVAFLLSIVLIGLAIVHISKRILDNQEYLGCG